MRGKKEEETNPVSVGGCFLRKCVSSFGLEYWFIDDISSDWRESESKFLIVSRVEGTSVFKLKELCPVIPCTPPTKDVVWVWYVPKLFTAGFPRTAVCKVLQTLESVTDICIGSRTYKPNWLLNVEPFAAQTSW